MKAVALALIRAYQRFISPALPPSCRYHPSCSRYGYEAIEKHGLFKGMLLAAWRVLRCNPLARGGYDPVPETWPAHVGDHGHAHTPPPVHADGGGRDAVDV